MRMDVVDLFQGYGSNIIIKDVSFSAELGEVVSILGPNGSGKSTLIKTMCNIMKPKSGDIRIDDVGIADISKKDFAKKVAYVPQSSEVFGVTSVYDTVLAGRRPYIDWDYRSEDIRIAADAMRTMGVDKLHSKSLSELSGGQRQRVHIARALAQNSGFFVLDEPTSALDLHHQLETMKIMKELCKNQNKGAIIALHDLNLALNYCDRVIILSNNTIYDQGPAKDVITEEMIHKVYGVRARIFDDEFGSFIHAYDADIDKTGLNSTLSIN